MWVEGRVRKEDEGDGGSVMPYMVSRLSLDTNYLVCFGEIPSFFLGLPRPDIGAVLPIFNTPLDLVS